MNITKEANLFFGLFLFYLLDFRHTGHMHATSK